MTSDLKSGRSPPPAMMRKERPEACTPSSFTVAPTLNIGGKKYFKSLKPCGCCDMQECCIPSIVFKTTGDATYKIQHGCCCLPCCFGFSAYSSKEKIGSYTLGGCTDAPCCGPLVVDGKFMDAKGEAVFFLKHDAVCCDGFKVCCASFCHLFGCLTCYKYYCSDEQYREYRQPIYRTLENSAPVAYFKYIDRIRGPCSSDERLSMSIEPADDLSPDDFQLLAFYLVLTFGYVDFELGLNFSYLSKNSVTPYGLEGIDELVGIHKRSLTEKDAVHQGLINMY
eukprot:CAMPEP_0170187488 /NCGR_PEP_ID=MMETSP0040_2-20121228/41847_1 /TAXON_ID=641309 /ORGANISM="Lotharella oceanica, Strain CCMP622" /LENGTH=280 /DNA_ID=CAMNT_0010434541 /DNA_START=22 /DNA_END=864 /DNA_ORIENTATION=+